MSNQVFTRFVFKMRFGWISYMATAPGHAKPEFGVIRTLQNTINDVTGVIMHVVDTQQL